MELKEITTNRCSFCGAEETHDIEGWIKADWRFNLFIMKWACSKPECHASLITINE